MVTATPEGMNTETNVNNVSASEDSKIGLAARKVTRLFNFEIKAGQNNVTILELPRFLQED
jgi:hypothetical protein